MSRETHFLKAYGGLGLAEEHRPDEFDSSPPWPTLRDEAFYGLPGEVVKAVEPHTEADPAALLVNLMIAFGNALGRGAYLRVGAAKHHLNIFAALVGETAKGRKGTSWEYPKSFMHAVDSDWVEGRVVNGLSSGEGLIYAVRDRLEGEDKDGKPFVLDSGAEDKRLLAVEGELASVLKIMSREGNTLSALVRQAWDGGTLQTLTRNSPLKATDPHISIIGHVTKQELLKYLTGTETANGFANRFVWLMVKRSKKLPFGGGTVADENGLTRLLKANLNLARGIGEISWGESAKAMWVEAYDTLSEGKPGLLGAVTGRAEAQAMRWAALYAVMDGFRTIEEEHLSAALALWDYAEESARYIFGDATGDPVADRIADALRGAPDGLTRTQMRDLFGRNKSSTQVDQALTLLLGAGRVCRKMVETGGRPAESWYAN